MEVIPAIDLKDGACVRLYQGDFNRETVFSRDPVEIALRWERAGAPRLHIVDLDGSRHGVPTNLGAIEAIVGAVNIPLQVGGGIRSRDTAQRLLESGVDRIIMGSAAVEDPDLVERLCRDWGAQRVVVAVDAREGKVAIRGWLKDTSLYAVDLVLRMAQIGPQRFLYTDISRDGTMTSPNFEAVSAMVSGTGQAILASGGVSALEDIRRLVQTGVEGVVVGSALYRCELDLTEAIKMASGD